MRKPFVAERLKVIAAQIGAQIEIEPEYGFVGRITFANGKRTFFKSSYLDANPNGAVKIASDKGYANYFLERSGYDVPKSLTVFSETLNKHIKVKRDIDAGYRFARQIGFPIIIKPNDRSMGVDVYKIYNKAEYYQFADLILSKNSVMMIQEFCEGNDYRLVVFKNRVYCAYQRIPLRVRGDGLRNIRELIEKRVEDIRNQNRNPKVNPEDFRIKRNLEQNHLSLDYVLPQDKMVKLLDNANLATGGDALDFTDKLNKEFVELAVNVTRDMGLQLCGLDLITDSLEASPINYKIIEINASPGLNNFAQLGEKQSDMVNDLYFDILKTIEERN